jgi:2-polyprenyl-3-methyl-5-hydroxy-6-metoxy-1,4-benzoquinol methylase
MVQFTFRKSYRISIKYRIMTEDTQHFSANDIRPRALEVGQQEAIRKDIEMLLSRKVEFVEVQCPACGALHTRDPFDKNGFSYATCTSCKTMYMNPRPTEDIIEEFLKKSENYAYWDKYIFPASDNARRKKIFVPRVDRLLEICKKYKIDRDAIMDVGAGHGTFCEELNKRKEFKRVVGVEPSTTWATTCRSKGVEVIELPIEKMNTKEHGFYDAITNFEVIEHLFSPREFLEQCGKFLKRGGLFVLTCPNGMGFDYMVLGENTLGIDHEHLNYFNPSSISLLLESCGFEVLETQTPGVLDADLVRNEIMDGTFDVSGQPFLKRILIDEWEKHGTAFQEFIQKQGLSSNMWIVARNTG